MNRKKFDQTLGQAVTCAIIFTLVVAGMTEIPRGDWLWTILTIVLLIFLVILNLVMIIGFTSLQNDSTKAFYAFVLPIYPLYLISEEIIRRWEWWHYALLLLSYGLCVFIISACFASRTLTRGMETIALVLFVFSTPYLYSALF